MDFLYCAKAFESEFIIVAFRSLNKPKIKNVLFYFPRNN